MHKTDRNNDSRESHEMELQDPETGTSQLSNAVYDPEEETLELLEFAHIADCTRYNDLIPVADDIFDKPDVRGFENFAEWNLKDSDSFVIPVHDYSVSIDVRPICDVTQIGTVGPGYRAR